MCRWARIFRLSCTARGALCTLPENSLVVQSLHSRLGSRGDERRRLRRRLVRLAGIPGSSFTASSRLGTIAIVRALAGHITSPLVFAHIRASTGSPVQQTNCHPFRHGRWLWMHNGLIHEFNRVKRDLLLAVDPALFLEIEGTTDSELLFHLALTLGLEDDPPQAVQRTIGLVEATGHEHGVEFPFQGTIATTDGECVWAFRYSSEGRSRSLSL